MPANLPCTGQCHRLRFLALLAVAGCAATSHDDPAPRPSRRDTNGGDPQSLEIDRLRNVSAEMADELAAVAAQGLAHDLPRLPAVRGSDHQRVLEIGAALNRVDARAPKLASAMQAVQAKLAQNEGVTGSFVLVDRTSDSAAAAVAAGAKTAGGDATGFDDPAQRTVSQTAAVQYHPDDIYVLSGEFSVSDDHAAARRTLTFSLRTTVRHTRGGEVAIDHVVSRVYRWNPKSQVFEPDA